MPGPVHSAETAPQRTPQAPDVRNLGTLLRVILLAEGIHLGFHLVLTGHPVAALHALLARAPLYETALLTSLLVMFLAAPRLAGLRFRHHAGVGMLVASSVTTLLYLVFARAWPELFGAGALLAGAVAAGVAGVIYFYLHWRALALSPALPEARLMALQARIRPHFLFNSLNAVLGLMRQDAARAETALENLADLFRALLAESRSLVPLARELELARAYLELEALRLGPRLRVVWHTPGLPLAAPVPQLILQPLLENAVIHGVEPNPEGGEVHVSILRKGAQLLIVIRNPVPPDAATSPPGRTAPSSGGGQTRRGNGMALNNIRERLSLHFDAEARLTHFIAGGEFIVQVELPLQGPAGHTQG